MPRTAGQVVDDLHALLTAAAVPGPYLLVAHSLGGLFARLYTQHRCGLGCIKMPGSEFLCNDFELERLAELEDPRRR